MIYSYNELIKKYKNQYQINKAVNEGKIFKVAHGFYSDDKDVNELEIITAKYPNAIFTSRSAYYFYNLTDVIPRKNYLAIEIHQKIQKKDGIELTYMKKELHELGVTTLKTHNAVINIYDREKLLIELVRNKNNFGYDYYKEVINNYREITNELDIQKMTEYLKKYKNKDNLLMTIKDEVF